MDNKNKLGGIYKGKSHDEGGIPIDVKETKERIEVEGGEPLISHESLQDDKVKELKGTNKEILTQINKETGGNDLNTVVKETHVKDVVVCKKTLNDNNVKTIKGTNKQIVSAINSEAGCNVIEQGAIINDGHKIIKYKNGNEILSKNNLKELVEDLYKDHHKAWEVSDTINKKVNSNNYKEYASKIIDLWNNDLKHHFKEEEDIFFPEIKNDNNKEIINELLIEHKWFENEVENINIEPTVEMIENFTAKIIGHIKVEESTLMNKIVKDNYKNMENSEIKKENITIDLNKFRDFNYFLDYVKNKYGYIYGIDEGSDDWTEDRGGFEFDKNEFEDLEYYREEDDSNYVTLNRYKIDWDNDRLIESIEEWYNDNLVDNDFEDFDEDDFEDYLKDDIGNAIDSSEVVDSKSFKTAYELESEEREENAEQLAKDKEYLISFVIKEYADYIQYEETAGYGGNSHYFYFLINENSELVKKDKKLFLEKSTDWYDEETNHNKISREFLNLDSKNAVFMLRISNHGINEDNIDEIVDGWVSYAIDIDLISGDSQKGFENPNKVTTTIGYEINREYRSNSIVDKDSDISDYDVRKLFENIDYDELIESRKFDYNDEYYLEEKKEYLSNGKFKQGGSIVKENKVKNQVYENRNRKPKFADGGEIDKINFEPENIEEFENSLRLAKIDKNNLAMFTVQNNFFEQVISNNPNLITKFLLVIKDLKVVEKEKFHFSNIFSLDYANTFYKQFVDNLKVPLWKLIPEQFKKVGKVKAKPFQPNPNNKGLYDIVKDFQSKDELREVMTGTYFNKEKSEIAVTNAHVLLLINNKVDVKETGIYKITNVGSKEIDGQYPNYDVVIPRDNEFVISVKTMDLYKFSTIVKKNKLTPSYNKNIILKQDVIHHEFNNDNLNIILKSMLMLGHDEIDILLSDKINKPIVILPKNNIRKLGTEIDTDLALLMPIVDDSNIVNTFIYNLDNNCIDNAAPIGLKHNGCVSIEDDNEIIYVDEINVGDVVKSIEKNKDNYYFIVENKDNVKNSLGLVEYESFEKINDNATNYEKVRGDKEAEIKTKYIENKEKIYKTPSLKIQKEKYPIVLEWSEGSDDENKGYNSIEELEKDLLSFGFTDEPNETYIKNKIWFKGYPNYVQIDLGKSEGDYNPEKEKLINFLKNYDKNFDFSQFSHLEKTDKKLKELEQKTIEEAKKREELEAKEDERLRAEAKEIEKLLISLG